jgi:hypothetical protein
MKIGIWNECDYDECDLVLRLVETMGFVFLCAVDEDGNRVNGGVILGFDHTDGAAFTCPACEAPGLLTDSRKQVVVYTETDSGICPLNPGEDE